MAFCSSVKTAGCVAALALTTLSAAAHADRVEIPGFAASVDVPAQWQAKMTSFGPEGQPARHMYLLEAPHASDDEGVFCHVMSAIYPHPVTDAVIRDSQTLDEQKKQVLTERLSQMLGAPLTLDKVDRSRFAKEPAARLFMSGSKPVETRQANMQLVMWAGSTHMQSVTLQCVAVTGQGAERAAALMQQMMPTLNGIASSIQFEAKQAQDGKQ
ncbi:hypothetical protein [Amantichitinum ursilacus]|uniref:Uncharacterized protein n=1 Tax=Amantichitinum ursilacus TaxID=857265 RepID=A0A0N0XIG9_9NEIS|nr:hypothetical protein [Amantichitinum ursilacus]KPC50678.1 hypothetical protein WG78_16530 [Amantichitinum ursilacus]